MSFLDEHGLTNLVDKIKSWVEGKGYLTTHQDISGKVDKTDNALATTAKTVVGAINEVNNKFTNSGTVIKTNSYDDPATSAVILQQHLPNNKIRQAWIRENGDIGANYYNGTEWSTTFAENIPNKVNKTGDTMTGALTVTNGTQSVSLWADGEGGTLDFSQPVNNRGVQFDTINGNARFYVYQQNPWAYKNDLFIKDDVVTTSSDFVNGNGVSLNGLNSKTEGCVRMLKFTYGPFLLLHGVRMEIPITFPKDLGTTNYTVLIEDTLVADKTPIAYASQAKNKTSTGCTLYVTNNGGSGSTGNHYLDITILY